MAPSIAATTMWSGDGLAQTDAHTRLPPPRSQHHPKVRPLGPRSRRHHFPSERPRAGLSGPPDTGHVGLADRSNGRSAHRRRVNSSAPIALGPECLDSSLLANAGFPPTARTSSSSAQTPGPGELFGVIIHIALRGDRSYGSETTIMCRTCGFGRAPVTSQFFLGSRRGGTAFNPDSAPLSDCDPSSSDDSSLLEVRLVICLGGPAASRTGF
jgi:hypothetical protein